jgi:hypothetical protein
MRKANLARLLARRIDGIFLSDFEQGEIGPDLFRHACLMGLEGLVSKHRESPYRADLGAHDLGHETFRVRKLFSGKGQSLSSLEQTVNGVGRVCPLSA